MTQGFESRIDDLQLSHKHRLQLSTLHNALGSVILEATHRRTDTRIRHHRIHHGLPLTDNLINLQRCQLLIHPAENLGRIEVLLRAGNQRTSKGKQQKWKFRTF